MDDIYAKDLKPGARVAVFMGAGLGPPIVTTATVLHEPDDGFVWLGVDFTTNDDALPQRYQTKEVIGYLLPLATTTHHPDGSVTGTIPPGYVGP